MSIKPTSPSIIAMRDEAMFIEEHRAPTLTLEQVKEAIAAWPVADQHKLYKFLNIVCGCRMERC